MKQNGKILKLIYQNSIIKIKFLFFDVGDSNYDSAVVIDNIKIY